MRIKLTSTFIGEGERPYEDSEELFSSLEALENDLSASAEDDYKQRVISGLKDQPVGTSVTVANGPGWVDVYTLV